MSPASPERVKIVIVGAGQSALSAAYHLTRRGFRAGEDFLVLDSDRDPGGAWQHYWPTLTFGGANRIADLPGLGLGSPEPGRPASEVIAEYFAAYEEAFDLRVRRPWPVTRVENAEGRSRDTGLPLLRAVGPRGELEADLLMNATGTWKRPFVPHYRGQESFNGPQIHTREYRSPERFEGLRVGIVGAGISAIQLTMQISRVAQTFWFTRREPEWTERPFDENWGRDVIRRVDARARKGLPPLSVAAATKLPLTPEYRRAIEEGTLRSRPIFREIVPDGVITESGEKIELDSLVWCTGFRANLDHLAPLRLREPGGGILMDPPRVVKDPRVQLLGYGPSASTIGASRTGRVAARNAANQLSWPKGTC